MNEAAVQPFGGLCAGAFPLAGAGAYFPLTRPFCVPPYREGATVASTVVNELASAHATCPGGAPPATCPGGAPPATCPGGAPPANCAVRAITDKGIFPAARRHRSAATWRLSPLSRSPRRSRSGSRRAAAWAYRSRRAYSLLCLRG